MVSTDCGVSEETSPRYTGWRIVAVCFVTAVFSWTFGFYGQGVYLEALASRHDWSVSMITGASTVYFLSSSVLVIFVGSALTRFGPRLVILSGVFCFAVSVAFVGRIDALWQLYADYIVMSFGWAAMNATAMTIIIGAWFSERRGLAIALALVGGSLGGLVMTPVLVMLIARIGLATTLLYGIAIMVVVLVPMSLRWLRRFPGSHGQAADTARQDSPWTRRRALRDTGFRTLTASSALALFAQVGFLVLEIAFLTPRIGHDEAGIAVSVTAGMSIVGRLTLGGFIDRLDPRLISVVSYLVQGAALFSMLWIANTIALVVACAVFGFFMGNVLIFPALVVQREFAPPAFPLLISFTTAIRQFPIALAPGVLGLLRNATGSYHLPLAVCVVLEIMAAAIVSVRGRRRSE